MFVTQKVLEHLSREPQYYLPPDSNIYFHYRAATKAATKEPFEKLSLRESFSRSL